MSPSDAIAALLQQPGWTEAKIAKAIGTSQPTINRIKQGSEPAWSKGDALVALARRVTAGSGGKGSRSPRRQKRAA